MTERDPLAALRDQLAPIDIDGVRAERIARRARRSLGRGPAPWRLLEPAAVALLTMSFLVWMVLKLVEVLG